MHIYIYNTITKGAIRQWVNDYSTQINGPMVEGKAKQQILQHQLRVAGNTPVRFYDNRK